jgi:hypothetical protein
MCLNAPEMRTLDTALSMVLHGPAEGDDERENAGFTLVCLFFFWRGEINLFPTAQNYHSQARRTKQINPCIPIITREKSTSMNSPKKDDPPTNTSATTEGNSDKKPAAAVSTSSEQKNTPTEASSSSKTTMKNHPDKLEVNKPLSIVPSRPASVSASPPPTMEKNRGNSEGDGQASRPQQQQDMIQDTERQSLREFDILTGRGSGPNQSQGNTRFRQVVWETYQEHLSSMGVSTATASAGQELSRGSHFQHHQFMDSVVKNKLATKILAKIQALNGRFLRRISPEDFRNLPEHERALVIRVPETVPTPSKREKSVSSESTTEVSSDVAAATVAPPQKRTTFYVQLSTKETMEKIKQSLRFQVDRSEQQKEHHLHRDQIRQQAISGLTEKKRKATHQLILPSLGGGLKNTSEPDAKRQAPSFSLIGRSNLPMGLQVQPSSFVPGLSTADATAAVKAGQAELLAKLLQAGGGTGQPLTGHASNEAVIDFAKWPPAKARSRAASMDLGAAQKVSTGNVYEAAAQLHRLQQEQVRDKVSLEALNALQMQNNSMPSISSPGTSTLRNLTQMEALSRLLLQEQFNAEIDARLHRNHELNVASSLLRQRLVGSAAGLLGGNFGSHTSFVSMAPGQDMLTALLARNEAFHRQSLPIGTDNSGSVSAVPDRRMSLPNSNLSTNESIASLFARLGQHSGGPVASTYAGSTVQDQKRSPSLQALAPKPQGNDRRD